MKRVLIVGPDYHGYNQSISRCFEKLNFNVKIVEYYEGCKTINQKLVKLINKKKFNQILEEDINMKILKEYENYKPNIVLFIKGSIIKVETLKKINCKKVLWCMDSIFNIENIIPTLDLYDKVFSFEKSDIKRLKKIGIECLFLPMAVDEFNYYPIINKTKDIDISFVGGTDRERRKILEDLVLDFPNAKIEVYGKAFNLIRIDKYIKNIFKYRNCFKNKNITPKEVNNLYSRSKICLNLHNKQSIYGCNPRFYEIAASDSFQIVDNNKYIETEYSYVVRFKDYEDLKNKIGYYLNNEDARNNNIKNNIKIVETNYFINRIKFILDVIDGE